MAELREYQTRDGSSPFAYWFQSIDARAAARVNAYLTRVSHGNFSRVEGVGSGVFECKVDYGPGYRVYFGKDGDKLIILLAGGTKKRQQQDIQHAKEYWQDYKKRKGN